MKLINELKFGFADAENYKRREDKEMFNKAFIRNEYLDALCEPHITFLMGEKGTGKTAYAVFMSNNDYKNNRSCIKYIRETDYQKFITLKENKQLQLSDYVDIWKVIIYLLLCREISHDINNKRFSITSFGKIKAVNAAIDEYYRGAFSPEIIQAFEFVQDSKLAAEIVSKHTKIHGDIGNSSASTESKFQINLLYIQKQFEDALKQVRPQNNYILFIDGIDIRPANIPHEKYLDCVKGLANAIWQVNTDFFPKIKGGKGRCRSVLLVRPDILASVGLQNQNAKIQDNTVYLGWQTEYSAHRTSKIFKVADRLLSIQQNKQTNKIGECWDHYFPWDAPKVYDEFEHTYPTSFISFLRWSYYRPRDIVQLLKLLQKDTNNKQKSNFTLVDFDATSFQRSYSNYLLGEAKDQLLFYYQDSDYENFLKFFEFLRGAQRFTYDRFCAAYDDVIEYLKSIKKDPPRFMSSSNEFLQFLYDMNVICYIEKPEQHKPLIHWCFRERNYSNISPKVKTHVDYLVFYGLAKALNLGKKY